VGGHFEGYTGVQGVGSGAEGYGGYFESAHEDGLHVHSAGDNGVYVDSAGWHGVSIYEAEESGLFVGDVGDAGVWVWLTGDDGVRVSGAGDDAVYADTLQTNNEWGVYTPDKLFVGTSLGSGGPILLVVQNGDTVPLETGDLVAASGLGQPFAGSPAPITLVRLADGESGRPVVGAVASRFEASESAILQVHEGDTLSYSEFEAHSTGGPAARGDFLLLCVLGPCQVKANAELGPIQPGDALSVAGDQGTAVRARMLSLDGVAFYPPGITFATALEPLPEGSGLIQALITAR
jgi:hypothetical protein